MRLEKLREMPRNCEFDLSEVRLFVFDWSGVISDDRRPVYKANMRVLREYGRPTMSFDEWLPKTMMTPVEFFASQGVCGKPDELFALYKKYFDETVESGIVSTVYSGVYELLESLAKKGRKIAVLSSHPERNVRREAGEYGLSQFLDLIAGSSKDKVTGLVEICREIGESPEATLYVGDTIYDIRAAKKAECWSVGVCSGYHSKEKLIEEEPDLLLDTVSVMSGLID